MTGSGNVGDKLLFYPAINNPHLVSSTVLEKLNNWQSSVSVNEILVAEIDPAFSAGEALCQHYSVSTDEFVKKAWYKRNFSPIIYYFYALYFQGI